MGVQDIKRIVQRHGGSIDHERDLRYVIIILHNQIVFWLDGKAEIRFLSNKEHRHYRDFIECVLDASEVIEETALMRSRTEKEESFHRDRLLKKCVMNEKAHEVSQPHLISNIKEYRERKDNLVKQVTEEIVTMMCVEWSKENRDEAISNEFNNK